MKISSLVLVLALLLSVSTPALARDGAIPTLKQEIKDKREEVKVKNLENKRTKAQATLKRLRQGIVNRYNNILKQKTNIEARIAKIGTTRDLTAAKAKLATFDTSKYVTDLASFDTKSAEVLASATPLKLTPELKTLAKALDTDIKTMRTTLADTLRLIIRAR